MCDIIELLLYLKRYSSITKKWGSIMNSESLKRLTSIQNAWDYYKIDNI